MARFFHAALPTRWPCVALACVLALLLPFSTRAAEALTEPAVRAMVRELGAAASARQLAPFEARLAPDCEIAVQVTSNGRLATLRFSRREYLEFTAKGWAEMARQNITYRYSMGPAQVRLGAGGTEAVVTATSTETLAAPDGRQTTVTTLTTLRVEVRDGRLAIVSMNAVPSG